MKLEHLARRLRCELDGDGSIDIQGVAGIEDAGPGQVSFVANKRYLPQAALTRAAALIVSHEVVVPVSRLMTPNPYLAFARAVCLLHPRERPEPGVHPSAQVDPSARLGAGVHVGPLATLGPRVQVGARSVIHSHVVLYAGVEIGEDCVLHAGAQVREGCRLGQRVVLQNGAVIGSDGFGFARDDAGRYEKFPQIGIVVIEDDVDVGALTAIDRAALKETRIGRGTKIDNLVQIGHSVRVGRDTVLAGQVGIAGSTHLGDRVTLAGQVGVAGHVTIGDGVVATAQTGIPSSLEAGTRVSGYPAIANRTWLKASAVFTRLPELQKRVRQLEAQIERLTRRAGADEKTDNND